MSVTPDGGSGGTVVTGQTGLQTTFTVSYENDNQQEDDEFEFYCDVDGVRITNCSVDPIGWFLSPGQNTNVTVTFSTSSTQTGTGWVYLEADGLLTGFQDTGSKFFTVSPAVPVTPNSVPSAVMQYAEGDTAKFDVENKTGTSGTFSFDCDWGGGACPDPSSTFISNNQTKTVAVAFDAGSITGSHDLTLTATKGAQSGSDTASVTVTSFLSVNVVSQLPEVFAEPDAQRTDTFVVRFPGQSPASFAMSATCPGGATEARNCSVPAADDTLAVGDTPVQVRVTYTAGEDDDTSAVTLTATRVGQPALTQSGDVQVIAASDVRLSVYDANVGLEVNRGDCLNVAAGPGAILCDDYQLVYPFTTVTRMNRPRQIGLIYNSALPHPQGRMGVNIVFPAGEAKPDSINVELVVADSTRGNETYASWHYQGGEKFRVARTWTWAAGAFEQLVPYTFYVTQYDGGVVERIDSITGKHISLDKRRWFGRGWWLAGYEHVRARTDPDLGDVLIWTGADASARVYIEESTDTFVAWSRAVPDTIVDVGTEYVRRLLGGGEVRFNASGYHSLTINANNDTTIFSHELDGNYTVPVAIQVPTPNGPDTIFKLDYHDTAGRLEKVLVRSASGGWDTFDIHATSATSSQFQIDSIVAPDDRTMHFGFDGGPGGYRLDTIVDFRGAETVIDWTWSAVRGVTTRTPEDTVVVDYLAASPVGISHWGGNEYRPRPSDSLRVVLNGPLPTDADSTTFYVTGWGAVRGTRDALLNETRIHREDEDFPALPTRIRYPNGREVTASYDNAGRLTSTVDGATGGTTTYAWKESVNKPDTIVSPEGVKTVFTYDGNGNRLTQKVVGGGTTTYTYDADGLVIRVVVVKDGLENRDTIAYDSRGNVSWHKTPLNYQTTIYRDFLGRDTLTVSPDGIRSRVVRDVMGRVVLEGTTNTSDDLWTRVHTTYDSVGRPIKVQAYGDTTTAAQDSMSTGAQVWAYDGLGRVTVQSASAKSDTMFYDLAGNVTEIHTDRGDTIRMEYDVLGRLEKRVVSSVSYVAQAALLDTLPLPAYSAGGLTIPKDSVLYTYDVMGNPLTIDNRYAHITRTYTLDGLVATDQQAIMNYPTGVFTNHVYDLGYSYNRDRQRVALQHPTWLNSDPTVYDYDALGRISTITGPEGDGYTYTYDDADRITKRTFPAGGETLWSYDNDDRLTSHVIRIGTDTALHNTMSIGPTGRVNSIDGDGSGDVDYNGLGAVSSTFNLAWEGAQTSEEFASDPFGTQLRTKSIGGEPQDDSVAYTNTVGAYRRISASMERWASKEQQGEADGWEPGFTDYVYDNSGNRAYTRRESHVWDFSGLDPNISAEKRVTHREESKSFYSADNLLMVHQVNRDSIDHTPVPDQIEGSWGTYEEYWYDGLGRRILKRTREDSPHCEISARCDSSIERIVWDGQQILWEVRQAGAGNTKDPSAGDQTGNVGYVHGADVDAPIAMIRNGTPIMLHQTWRGLYAFSTNTAGAYTTCTPSQGLGCTVIPWPGGNFATFLWAKNQETHTWYGSLILDQRDATGLSYRRNRYYDPLSGQFTQQDPIGIAGGLNLYGYAGGDPINFSDPFGLGPCDEPGEDASVEDWEAYNECRLEEEAARHAAEAQEAVDRAELFGALECYASSVSFVTSVATDAAILITGAASVKASAMILRGPIWASGIGWGRLAAETATQRYATTAARGTQWVQGPPAETPGQLVRNTLLMTPRSIDRAQTACSR